MSKFPDYRVMVCEKAPQFVAAIQDCFGGQTYRCLSRRYKSGEVFTRKLFAYPKPSRTAVEPFGRDQHFRVVGSPIDREEMHAILWKARPKENLRLMAGHWYRVIED